jgi:hypothetical protein
MPINVTVHLNDVFRRVGKRRVTHSYTFEDPEWRLRAVRYDPLGLYFVWPRTLRFLDLVASWYAPGHEETRFGKDEDALRQTYAHFQVDIDIADSFFAEKHVLSAVVPRAATVRLKFIIDTDDETFFRLARSRPGGTGPVSVAIETHAFDSMADEDPGEIRLNLTPAEPPADYQGCAALDLGNAATSLACLPAGQLRGRDVLIVDAEGIDSEGDPRPPAPNAPAVDSIVRLDEVPHPDHFDPYLVHPQYVQWEIGEKVLAGEARDGLVFGAKRLLASQHYREHRLPVFAKLARYPEGRAKELTEQPQQVQLPEGLPGELLACRLLQRFREVTRLKPPALAVTHPTTWSYDELLRLQDVVARALARQDARLQDEERLQQYKAQIQLLIDEASAAAFYFLFRRIFEVPGGLSRFGYLYPNGQNMLLIDVGAGTIDICLAQASAAPARTPTVLRVDVRGRSGLRDFGGDDITSACFRLLKARIALKLGETLGRPQPGRFPDNNPAELPAYLDRHADIFNTLVPTRFRRDRLNRDDLTHRNHTRDLWALALEVKHRMETLKPDEQVEVFPKNYNFTADLWRFLFQQVGPAKQTALREQLKQIRVARKQLDELVRGPIMVAIERCNWLIKQKLLQVEPGLLAEDVHQVQVLGNGARYPLVQELLRERLHVAFYNERSQFDRENLKGAVAKGAALLLALREGAPDLRVEFDKDLSRRLPFNVAVRNMPAAVPNVLFREHQLYDELKPHTIQVLTEDQQPSRFVDLERNWPGEVDAQGFRVFVPWQRFHFPQGVRGPVTISYDPQRGFVAEDGYTTIDRADFIGDQAIYLSPPERGTM